MTEKYCVTIQGASKHHEHDTMAALLEVDQTLAPLRVFDSINEAVDAARWDKVDHPEWDYEVRQYFGNNTDIRVIEKRGRWNLSEEIFARV